MKIKNYNSIIGKECNIAIPSDNPQAMFVYKSKITNICEIELFNVNKRIERHNRAIGADGISSIQPLHEYTCIQPYYSILFDVYSNVYDKTFYFDALVYYDLWSSTCWSYRIFTLKPPHSFSKLESVTDIKNPDKLISDITHKSIYYMG